MTASRSRWTLVAIGVLFIAAGVVLWRYTPLSQWATLDRVSDWIRSFKDAPAAPFAVIALFVVGGLVFFPLLLLIAATALVFEPLVAVPLALSGALASASVMYLIGAKLARGIVQRAFGSAMKRASSALENRGMLAVAAVRLVPIAPYSLVNLAAGSIGIRFTDYLIGTAIGLAPGTIMLTAFGSQLRELWTQPSTGKVVIFIAIVLAWVALSLGLQKLTARRSKQSRGGA